jgi:hypothetical protein
MIDQHYQLAWSVLSQRPNKQYSNKLFSEKENPPQNEGFFARENGGLGGVESAVSIQEQRQEWSHGNKVGGEGMNKRNA